MVDFDQFRNTLRDKLEDVYEFCKHLDVDPGLFQYFRIGVVLGFCLVTGLAFFPGRDNVFENMEGSDANDGFNLQATTKSDQKQVAAPDTARITKIDDNLHEEEIVFLRRMMNRRRGHGEGGWTPHQQLNYAMYIIIFAAVFAVIIYVYDSERTFFLYLLAYYFPREASALGWVPPKEKILSM